MIAILVGLFEDVVCEALEDIGLLAMRGRGELLNDAVCKADDSIMGLFVLALWSLRFFKSFCFVRNRERP